jgi:hypothetical protein
MLADDIVVVAPRALSARVQAELSCHQRDRLNEHAVVEPTALPECLIDGEDDAARGAKEWIWRDLGGSPSNCVVVLAVSWASEDHLS